MTHTWNCCTSTSSTSRIQVMENPHGLIHRDLLIAMFLSRCKPHQAPCRLQHSRFLLDHTIMDRHLRLVADPFAGSTNPAIAIAHFQLPGPQTPFPRQLHCSDPSSTAVPLSLSVTRTSKNQCVKRWGRQPQLCARKNRRGSRRQ